ELLDDPRDLLHAGLEVGAPGRGRGAALEPLEPPVDRRREPLQAVEHGLPERARLLARQAVALAARRAGREPVDARALLLEQPGELGEPLRDVRAGSEPLDHRLLAAGEVLDERPLLLDHAVAQ